MYMQINKNKFLYTFFALLFVPALICNAQVSNSSIPLFTNTAKESNELKKILSKHLLLQEKVKNTKAVKIKSDNIENFYKVSNILYRGGQPSADGIKELKAMGIKTIINLRIEAPSDRSLAEKYGIRYYDISMSPTDIRDSHAQKFLDVLSNPLNHPVFVHCRYGSDRTGAMVGIYRIAFEDWSRAYAVDEMKNGGFKFSPIFANLAKYLNAFKIDRFRLTGILKSKYPPVLTSADNRKR